MPCSAYMDDACMHDCNNEARDCMCTMCKAVFVMCTGVEHSLEATALLGRNSSSLKHSAACT